MKPEKRAEETGIIHLSRLNLVQKSPMFFGQFKELVLFNWPRTGFSIFGDKKGGAYVLKWLALPKKSVPRRSPEAPSMFL